MDISIIGSDMSVWVTAPFADVGHHVICVDNDSEKVKQLKAARYRIYEPGREIIHRNGLGGRLHFTGNIQEAVERSQNHFHRPSRLRHCRMAMSISASWRKLPREIAGVLTDFE